MATEEPISTLLLLRPLNHQGHRHLAGRWPELVGFVAERLAASAQTADTDEHGVHYFLFSHPQLAVDSWIEVLDQTRGRFGWKSAAGALPLQVLLRAGTGTGRRQRGERIAGTWGFVVPEAPHLTLSLKQMWERQAGEDALPGTVLCGLFRYSAHHGRTIPALHLIPGRVHPGDGGRRPCFYCGLTSHGPAQCGSRWLTVEQCGLSLVGRISMPELADHYREAFAKRAALDQQLAAGVSRDELESDLALQVYTAVFDIDRTFQLRFLDYLCFSHQGGWPPLGRLRSLPPNPASQLHQGLESLRAQRYAEAEVKLKDIEAIGGANWLFAELGLAFCALEQGKKRQVLDHLERAVNISNGYEEKLYAQLLLTRYYETIGDPERALEQLEEIEYAADARNEIEYRQIQLEAAGGPDDHRLETLNALIHSRKEYFGAVLLDPRLEAMRAPLDAMLASVLEAVLAEGARNLKAVRERHDQVASWLGTEDEALATLTRALQDLERRVTSDGYYSAFAVANEAQKLIYSCGALQEQRMFELEEHLSASLDDCNRFIKFWNAYKHKNHFKKFLARLNDVRSRLRRMSAALDQKDTESFPQAHQALTEVREQLRDLGPMVEEMRWTERALWLAKYFLRNLLVIELAALFLAVGLGAVVAFLLPAESASPLAALLRSETLHRSLMLFVFFFLAPVGALVRTLKAVRPRARS